MVASVLALPSQQWQPACWLTHFNYDGSQHAGFPSGQWQLMLAYPHSFAPHIFRVLKLYYKVASSHFPAPQILRVLKLYYKVASS